MSITRSMSASVRYRTNIRRTPPKCTSIAACSFRFPRAVNAVTTACRPAVDSLRTSPRSSCQCIELPFLFDDGDTWAATPDVVKAKDLLIGE
jgi:hypothetical protein